MATLIYQISYDLIIVLKNPLLFGYEKLNGSDTLPREILYCLLLSHRY